MLKLISGLAANVVGIEAVGKVEAADYRQVLEPAAAAAMQAHDRVRLLYVLGEQYEGYAAAAAWEDTRLGLHDPAAWERIAVVTDNTALGRAIEVFGWLIPGEVRTYSLSRLEDARRWVNKEAAGS